MVLDSDSKKVVKENELPEAFIRLKGDGIVHVHYKEYTTLDVELQERMRIVFKEITEGRKAKFIFTADEGFNLTKEARENSRQRENPVALAYAIIANNLAYRIIANFFLKVNRPKVPYKLFSSVEAAEKWLKDI